MIPRKPYYFLFTTSSIIRVFVSLLMILPFGFEHWSEKREKGERESVKDCVLQPKRARGRGWAMVCVCVHMLVGEFNWEREWVRAWVRESACEAFVSQHSFHLLKWNWKRFVNPTRIISNRWRAQRSISGRMAQVGTTVLKGLGLNLIGRWILVLVLFLLKILHKIDAALRPINCVKSNCH